MRNACLHGIEQTGIVVILRGIPAEKLLPLGEALYRGGIRAMEVTYDARGITQNEETARQIRLLAEGLAGRMFIGAGTVLTEAQVRLTKAAGGSFIVSPDTNPQVIRLTRQLDMVSIPGALTPTEIMEAHRAGADFVKLFPVTALGPGYIRAVAAPLSQVNFLAVGGMTLETIPAYLQAGACGIGIGANIVDKKLLDAEDWEGITCLARKYLEMVQAERISKE